MKKLHTVENWFKKQGTYTGEELLDYFESDFKENTMGTFKAPYSTVKAFNDFKTKQDKANAINAIGQTFINMIVGSPTGKELRKLPFKFLLEMDANELKTALCLEIQHASKNRHFWEKVNQSSMTTGTFSMNSDATAWLLNSDVFGQFAKTAIENSEIDLYEWVENNGTKIATYTKFGNITYIGTISKETAIELEL